MRKANVNNEEGIRKFIARRLDLLKKIESSDFPPDVEMHQRHRERIANATEFISELNYLLDTFTGYKLKLALVPKPTFDKLVSKAEFATIEMDDEYCKVCSIQDYLLGSTYIIYIAPIDKI